MTSLDVQLKVLNLQKKQILKKIDLKNSEKRIECGGCQGSHKIMDLI